MEGSGTRVLRWEIVVDEGTVRGIAGSVNLGLYDVDGNYSLSPAMVLTKIWIISPVSDGVESVDEVEDVLESSVGDVGEDMMVSFLGILTFGFE